MNTLNPNRSGDTGEDQGEEHTPLVPDYVQRLHSLLLDCNPDEFTVMQVQENSSIRHVFGLTKPQDDGRYTFIPVGVLFEDPQEPIQRFGG